MFGLFKKKSAAEKLQEEYAKLMKKAHEISHSDRKAGDALVEKAEAIAKKIDALKNQD